MFGKNLGGLISEEIPRELSESLFGKMPREVFCRVFPGRFIKETFPGFSGGIARTIFRKQPVGFSRFLEVSGGIPVGIYGAIRKKIANEPLENLG